MTPSANLVTNPPDWLTGFIPDIPTPFDETGALDLSTFARLCERQIRASVPAIVVGETSGEFNTLSWDERDAIIRAATEVADGRVRVIAGAGSNSTGQAAAWARRAEAAGADALLSVVPYYNKPMQAGIEAHFRAIANATALPIILHDDPTRTIRGLADDTLVKLSESPQFVGLKDSTDDLSRPARLRCRVPARFRLLSGHDTTALAFLCSGGDGCISILSNVAPFACSDIFSGYEQGQMMATRQRLQRLSPLAELLAAENPAAVKYALSLLGLMRPDTRLPLVGLSDQAKAQLVDAMMLAIGERDLTRDERNASRAILARAPAYSNAPGDIS
jgi:4-hydroxy-tetrahydrodipicolinate synthase